MGSKFLSKNHFNIQKLQIIYNFKLESIIEINRLSKRQF